MKKIKLFALMLLVMFSVVLLAACGDGGGKGNNTKAVEALKASVEAVLEKYETLEYEKFSLTYEQDNDIELRKVWLDYDPSGYFYSKEYLEERVVAYGEKEKYLKESYVWVDGSKLTKAYYYKNQITNAQPTKQFWVQEFSSHEEALEEFKSFLSGHTISDVTFLQLAPSSYAINKTYQPIEYMLSYLAYFLEGDERISVTINSHNDLSFDFDLKFNNSTFNLKSENGIITAYTANEPVTNHKETLTLSLNWEFVEPDLSGYYDYSY